MRRLKIFGDWELGVNMSSGKEIETKILETLAIPQKWGDWLKIKDLRQKCVTDCDCHGWEFEAALQRLRGRKLVESAGWGLVRLVKTPLATPPPEPASLHYTETPKPPSIFYILSLQAVEYEDNGTPDGEFIDVPECLDLPTRYSTLQEITAAMQELAAKSSVSFVPCGETSYWGKE